MKSLSIFVLACLVACCCAAHSWTFESVSDASGPHDKEGSRMSAHGRGLWVYGGYTPCFGRSGLEHEYDTAIYKYDLGEEQWVKYDPIISPGPRVFHAQVSHEATRSVYIYSGVLLTCANLPIQRYSDMWRFDEATEMWSPVVPANAGPGRRIGAGFAIVGDLFYVVGGLAGDFSGRNDIWFYNISSNTWTMELAHDAARDPHARFSGPFEYNDKHNMFVLSNGDLSPTEPGGEPYHNLTDTWVYFRGNQTWKNIIPRGYGVADTTQTHAFTYKDYLYMVGGDCINAERCENSETGFGDATYDKIWQINLTEEDPIPEDITASATGSLGKIKGAAFTRVGKTGYLWGGHRFICANPGEGEPEFNNNLYSWKLTSV